MKKGTNSILEARRFELFLKDLGIESPIQYFERDGDEITCITAQVIIMVSNGKALVTWEDDNSKIEYIVEEEGNPRNFRAFRECKEIPKYFGMTDVDADAPVKEYQIHRHAVAM